MGHLTVEVSVIVQKLVDARWAGVAFSIHPLTGREEHALVEYCDGLGEKLVSGHIIPTQVTLELETGKIIDTQNADETQPLPKELIEELSSAILGIQAHFKLPQDIEWAVSRDQTLYLLQSRPITRIHFRTDIDEFTNADFKDGGVSARVCTPLMYSLYREAMQSSMPAYFRAIKLISENAKPENWIDCFYGRPYWNASAVKRALLKVPGFDEKEFDNDLGIQKQYGAKGAARVPVNLKTLLPAIPVAIGLEREFNRCLKSVDPFLKTFAKKERLHLSECRRLRELSDP
jgi:hypothetical protein